MKIAMQILEIKHLIILTQLWIEECRQLPQER